MRLKCFCIFLLILSIYSCSDKDKQPIKRGFYYWQTSFNYNSIPSDSLWKSLSADKLYLRCFDVGWSEDAQAPVKEGMLTVFPATLSSKEVVPVVFISNKTFQNLDLEKSEELAVMTYKHLMASITLFTDERRSGIFTGEEFYKSKPYHQKSKDFNEVERKDSLYRQIYTEMFKEIQFDCDWTPSTKDKYFAFLKKVKVLFTGKLISCTVRLYSFRYPEKTGVPPVDRGILMCYNAGDITDINTANSLFDKKEILSYLKGASKYPLPLDAALPMFNWAVHYRGKELMNILSIDKLETYHSDKLEKKNNKLIAKEDFNYGYDYSASYIRKGDVFRIEETDLDQVQDIVPELEKQLAPGATISFYHITNYAFENHSEKIKAIFNSF